MLNKVLEFYLKKSLNKDQGFTLIELLVVVALIGILSAIAIPSMLGQSAKAKQSEAKVQIGSINKAQMAYRIENNGFATNIDSLGLGLPNESDYYTYQLSGDVNTTSTTAKAKDTALKGYSGGAVVFTDKSNNSAVTTVICENEKAGTDIPAIPKLQTGANTPEIAAVCNQGQKKL